MKTANLTAALSFASLVLMVSAGPSLAKLNVVVTTPDLAAVAQEIGGSEVEVTTLMRPTEDPHFIDPKPSFIVKLNRADALIEGGAELEVGWLPPLLNGARNSKLAAGAQGRIRANEGIQMLEVPSGLDRAKGDIHAAGNPHFLSDPVNAKILAQHLASALAALDSKSAGVFQANLKRFVGDLEARMPQWESKLAPFKGQTIVSYHNSWPYFAQRFGLKIDLFLEPKPGIPPTPAHLAEVITQMRERNAKVIIVDAYLDRRTAETVAARTGAKVVDVTQYPGGVKGTEGGYIHLMDYLVDAVAAALGGASK